MHYFIMVAGAGSATAVGTWADGDDSGAVLLLAVDNAYWEEGEKQSWPALVAVAPLTGDKLWELPVFMAKGGYSINAGLRLAMAPDASTAVLMSLVHAPATSGRLRRWT